MFAVILYLMLSMVFGLIFFFLLERYYGDPIYHDLSHEATSFWWGLMWPVVAPLGLLLVVGRLVYLGWEKLTVFASEKINERFPND